MYPDRDTLSNVPRSGYITVLLDVCMLVLLDVCYPLVKEYVQEKTSVYLLKPF